MTTKRISVVQQAATEIESNINQKIWAIGTRLPSQNELSKSLNISRASLREALSIIESKGFIQIQPGKGVYVVQAEAKPETSWPFKKYSITEVFEIRHELEGFAASMAAREATDEEISQLAMCIEQAEAAALVGDLLTVQNCDMEFHSQIINIAKNKLLSAFIKQFRQPVNKSQSPPHGDYTIMAPTLKEHAAIFNAIAMREPKLAKEAMQLHILNAALRANVEVRF
ncbi:FadR/GntR family transcriptional regulator [Thorsellia anophelis]|uniref:GntR family transcriptional regulator, transcriptional repressor for pyruvate dehydrogenase complex n=1 Tax=Thorsellia anophelis DSM 18579 TaxID=1123402 RepID=A0A1H9ZDZ3_9GAMM|nr:FadR/GntR family transcriptional regulator [Thorsellia anophelis]SES79844.1 GntR family transcriptional regulator, transcriptional repressor for pyruvate dehydrogenase complex [Thorsellia anophelis DSM 18579]